MHRRSQKMRRRALRLGARLRPAAQDLDHARPFTDEMLAAFERALSGEALVPGDSDYEAARQVVFRQFQRHPQIIVYAETAGDVRRSLEFAGRCGLSVTCRSSGHNSGGFSCGEGMLLDLGRMNSVQVDPARRLAVVQTGVTFHRLNAALSDHDLHVPGGGCDEVCVGGYMMGGGYGFTSREFGMNCDNVVEIRVMLWDGRIVTASADVEPDLFWAMRGGGGVGIGVLLEIIYRLHAISPMWGFALSWSASDAPAALSTLQAHYMRGATDARLGHQCAVMIAPEGPRLHMRGMFHGPPEEGRAAIAALLALPGTAFDLELRGDYVALNRALLEQPVPIPTAPDYLFEEMQSGYIATMLDPAIWRKVMEYMAASPSPWNDVGIEPYGGAIERAADPGAFIHRDVCMNFFVEVFWLRPEERVAALAWLDGFMALMRPHMNGEAYQNYPRPGAPDACRSYWGDACARLRRVRAKYNPHGWFAMAQGDPFSSDQPAVGDG